MQNPGPLNSYLRVFQSLRVDHSKGVAPHKPVLLLAVLKGFRYGYLKGHFLTLVPELVADFMQVWSLLVKEDRKPDMALPWFHLKTSGFWTLVPRSDVPASLVIEKRLRTLATLDQALEGVRLNPDLALLVMEPDHNRLLSEALLQKYFPGQSAAYWAHLQSPDIALQAIDARILQASSADYKSEIDDLLAQSDEDAVFLRGAEFKRIVPRVYGYTCCATGWRLSTTLSASLIDACHIIPFSESHDDTIRNGIALSPSLHRAFDRGLFTIDVEYRIRMSRNFEENETDFSLRKLDGQRILLPEDERYWPGREQLLGHWERWM